MEDTIYVCVRGGGATPDRAVYLERRAGAEDVPLDLRDVLADEADLWDDASLLAGALVQGLAEVDDVSFDVGVCAEPEASAWPLLIVDVARGVIGFAHSVEDPTCFVEWSFDEYIALEDEDVIEAFEGEDEADGADSGTRPVPARDGVASDDDDDDDDEDDDDDDDDDED